MDTTGPLELLKAKAKERQRKHGGTAPGRRKSLPQNVGEVLSKHDGEAMEQAAQLLGVNREYLRILPKILARCPELREPIRAGHLNIPQARQLAEAPPWLRAAALERFQDHGWDKRVVRAMFKKT